MGLEVKFDLFELIATASAMDFKDLGVESAMIIVEKKVDDNRGQVAILAGGKSFNKTVQMIQRAAQEDDSLMDMFSLALVGALTMKSKNGKKE